MCHPCSPLEGAEAVARALASHQCVPGSIPGPGVICELNLLLVIYSAPRGFFSGYSGFPLASKTNISKFKFDPGMHWHLWTSSCGLLGAPWVNKLHTLHLAIKEKKRTFKTHCEGKVLCQWFKRNTAEIQTRKKEWYIFMMPLLLRAI